MKKYEILMFDLDNTILDFDKSEDYALLKLIERFGIQRKDEFIGKYTEINDELWSKLEKGAVSFDELANSRFSLTMECFGQSVDGRQWNELYTDYLAEACFPIDGALEVVEALSHSFRIFIITNGLVKVQKKRIETSGLLDYSKGVFVSQLMGVSKPDRLFFERAAAEISNFCKEKTLVIGDSLSSDVKGGYNFGVDTAWLNKGGAVNSSGIKPTYEIKELRELYEILK